MLNELMIGSEQIFPAIIDILNNGQQVILTVRGGSMYPFLRGDIDSVELSYVDYTKLRKNDIVMIKYSNNEYVMHRIIKKEKNRFYIVGDAQSGIEGPLYEGNYIAIVTKVYRKDREIVCTSGWWRFLSYMWLMFRPVRGVIIHSYIAFHKVID